MKTLRHNPGLALAVPAFRLVANLEALSWIGLLLGMLFKYVLTQQQQLGELMVSIFGTVHGGLVIVYVALAVVTALRLEWPLRRLAVAVAATIPPFATVVFDWWAHSRGHYDGRGGTMKGAASRG